MSDEPWHPMKDPVAVKTLGKLIEELGELQSAAARCLIQGLEGQHPVTGKPNKEWLEDEIADVWAGMSLAHELFKLDGVRVATRAETKMERLRKWHANA